MKYVQNRQLSNFDPPMWNEIAKFSGIGEYADQLEVASCNS